MILQPTYSWPPWVTRVFTILVSFIGGYAAKMAMLDDRNPFGFSWTAVAWGIGLTGIVHSSFTDQSNHITVPVAPPPAAAIISSPIAIVTDKPAEAPKA